GLWAIGNADHLSELSNGISIVGSRIASAYGERACSELVGPLIARGYLIISGGAYGIDAMAHKATLALRGVTAAMMAGGLDQLYPSGNRDLFKAIASNGLILSELPPGAEPTKWRFLQRNRLIAALGQATVVIEANPKSGAVSTANRAIELERPLGAVPGPIDSPGSDGCHQLIRQLKAELITCAEDVIELLEPNGQSVELLEQGLGALETRVLDAIAFGNATIEKIRADAGLTNSEATLGLSGLALLGIVEQHNGGWQRR
ncbi:MAG: DNA-processing protein DprA, partial [Rhodoluna sp.]